MKKQILTLIIAFAVATSMGMITPEDTFAAAKAKKPAKVIKLKASPEKTSVKLKWKMSKRAKGYIIYMTKGNSKKAQESRNDKEDEVNDNGTYLRDEV